MKICLVNLASGFGGGENQTLLLAKELKNQEIELVAILNPKSKLYKKILEIGIPVIPSRSIFTGHMSKYLKNVDCFHAHDGRAVHWCCLHKNIWNVPYIVTRRVINPVKNKWLTLRAYISASRLIGVSSMISNQLLKRFPGQRCEMIMDSPTRYEIDQNNLENLKKKYSQKYVVVQAASLSRHKGFDISIETARILLKNPDKEQRDIHFLFLGEGPEEENLKRQSQGLMNVEFLGRKDNMGDWFALADCLILPSRMEGLGSVILEAMEARLPVIATKVGGIPEIVKDKVTGILIRPENPLDLAESILQIKKDEALAKEIVRNAYEFVQSKKIESAAKQYIKIYEEICSDKKRF